MNGALIYLFGFAGSGKLTIAKALHERIDSVLVDNHLANNVIFTVIDKDGSTPLPEVVWPLVERVRACMLDAIRDLGRPGRVFILTNELIDGVDRHDSFFRGVAGVAAYRNALFLPVRLNVEAEELARRVTSPERADRLKETDPDKALRKSAGQQVYTAPGYDCLELDVTRMPPEDAASRVLAELERRRAACNED